MPRNRGNVIEQNRRRRKRHAEFIRELKKDNPCVDCGKCYHFSAMKFVYKEKVPGDLTVSKMEMYSKEYILNKTQECDLVCANCLNLRNRANNERTTQVPHFIRGREYIEQQKTNKPCADCSNSFHFAIMEFDHRPGEIKKRNISKMYGYSLKNIELEIAKCDIVCANCHHLRTYDRIMQ